MENFDAIVIGAGNGGLTASAGLAQKGLKVLLLERHNIPGGCATSFCRGRFEFEVALHQLSGMGTPEKPGPLRMLMENLGVMDDLEFVEMSNLYTVVRPDGFKIALKADRNEATRQLQEMFPHEKGAIDEFFDLVYRYANEMLGVFVFKDPDVSRQKYPTLYEYALKPASEVLDRLFSDQLLKGILSVYWGYLGLPPTRLSFAYISMLFFTFMEFKPFHIRGGSQALSNALADKFMSHGGTIRCNCGVEKILVENGGIKGVVTEHGDGIQAKYIVSNASPVATYTSLIDPGEVPNNVFREMRGRSLTTSAFVLFIGFDCEPHELGITESTNFLMDNMDFRDNVLTQMHRLDIDDQLLVLSCYDVDDPDFSPKDTCQANVVTLKYGDAWLRVPPTQYNQVKYRCAESMLHRVEEVFPEVRGHVEEIEAATPMTHMRYLGHPNGAIYGFEQYMKDSMFFQPGRRSPIKGLYFASGWTGDCGFQATLEAGKSAAASILREFQA